MNEPACSEISDHGLMGMVMGNMKHKNAIRQEDVPDVEQRQCEYCRHFRKDEYTGYCHIHRAYVPKTFVCAQFASHDPSAEGE